MTVIVAVTVVVVTAVVVTVVVRCEDCEIDVGDAWNQRV